MRRVNRPHRDRREPPPRDVAEAVGFVEVRSRGSHHLFRHIERPRLRLNPQQVNGKAKEYQVKDLLATIEQEHLRRW